MSYTKVTHVIFDLDGLLLDTTALYGQASAQQLKSYGCEMNWELEQKLLGRSDLDSAQVIIDEFGLRTTPESYVKQFNEVATKILPDSQAKPGAQELVRHLHQHKVPIAICTGSPSTTYSLKTSKHQWFSLFNHVINVTDDPRISAGKPAPDCFELCAQQFIPSPQATDNVLVFEDAPNGVEAALAAKMQVVMVPDPRVPKEVRDKATLTLESLCDFEPQLFQLPAFE